MTGTPNSSCELVEHRRRAATPTTSGRSAGRRRPRSRGSGEHHLVHRRHRRVVGRLQLVDPAVELEGVEAGGARSTAPPADSGASRPAMIPWMWNSGITVKRRGRAAVSCERRGDVAGRRGRGCAAAAARSWVATWCPTCAAPAPGRRVRPAATSPDCVARRRPDDELDRQPPSPRTSITIVRVGCGRTRGGRRALDHRAAPRRRGRRGRSGTRPRGTSG